MQQPVVQILAVVPQSGVLPLTVIEKNIQSLQTIVKSHPVKQKKQIHTILVKKNLTS